MKNIKILVEHLQKLSNKKVILTEEYSEDQRRKLVSELGYFLTIGDRKLLIKAIETSKILRSADIDDSSIIYRIADQEDKYKNDSVFLELIHDEIRAAINELSGNKIVLKEAAITKSSVNKLLAVFSFLKNNYKSRVSPKILDSFEKNIEDYKKQNKLYTREFYNFFLNFWESKIKQPQIGELVKIMENKKFSPTIPSSNSELNDIFEKLLNKETSENEQKGWRINMPITNRVLRKTTSNNPKFHTLTPVEKQTELERKKVELKIEFEKYYRDEYIPLLRQRGVEEDKKSKKKTLTYDEKGIIKNIDKLKNILVWATMNKELSQYGYNKFKKLFLQHENNNTLYSDQFIEEFNKLWNSQLDVSVDEMFKMMNVKSKQAEQSTKETTIRDLHERGLIYNSSIKSEVLDIIVKDVNFIQKKTGFTIGFSKKPAQSIDEVMKEVRDLNPEIRLESYVKEAFQYILGNINQKIIFLK